MPVQVNVIGTIIFLTAVGLVVAHDPAGSAGRGRADRAMPGGCRRDRRSRADDDRAAATAARPARPRRRAGGLEPDHEPGRRPRRGLVADHDRRRALPGLLVRASASRTPATPIRGSSAAVQAQAAKLLHGQQNIVYHEAGLRLYERLRHVAARRRLGRVPVEQRRGGSRGGGQAGPGRDRPAGDHRLPLRVPRPDRPDDGADHAPRTSIAATSSRCPGASTTRRTRTAIGGRRAARTRRALHLRLGGAARPDVPPVRLPRAASRR